MNKIVKIISTIAITVGIVVLFACLAWHRYVNVKVAELHEQRQAAYIAKWLPVAIHAQEKDHTGQQVINKCLQYGGLSPAERATLEQQYQVSVAQTHLAR